MSSPVDPLPTRAYQTETEPVHGAGGPRCIDIASGLYLVMLLLILDVVLVLVRRHFGHMQNYHFIPWNLFLALIPYGVSLCVALFYRAAPRLWWFLLPFYGLWLLFLPNAPYLLTDFAHLVNKTPRQIWYDTTMLSVYALTGYVLAIVSLGLMHRPVRDVLGWRAGWLFVVVTLYLTGVGVHLGRVQRFNSWDVLSQTRNLMAELLDRLIRPFDHPYTVFDGLYYAAILLVGYVAYEALRDKETRSLILQGRAGG
jgi:uncharacterized membrane protein